MSLQFRSGPLAGGYTTNTFGPTSANPERPRSQPGQAQPVQPQSQGTPYGQPSSPARQSAPDMSAYNQTRQSAPNMSAYSQPSSSYQQYAPQPFTQGAVGIDGQRFQDPSQAFAQRDAMIEQINQSRAPMFAGGGVYTGQGQPPASWGQKPPTDFGAAMNQANQMVQQGWQNPFANQSQRMGQAQPIQSQSQGTPYPSPQEFREPGIPTVVGTRDYFTPPQEMPDERRPARGGQGQSQGTPRYEPPSQVSSYQPYVNNAGQYFAGSMSFAPGTPQEYQNAAYGQFANSRGYYQPQAAPPQAPSVGSTDWWTQREKEAKATTDYWNAPAQRRAWDRGIARSNQTARAPARAPSDETPAQRWRREHSAQVASTANQSWLNSMSPQNRRAYQLLQQW